MKGENTKLKPVNCDWIACRDTWTLKSFTRYSWFVRRQMSESDVRHLMSDVGCLMSDVRRLVSDIRRLTSQSDVWWRMFEIRCLDVRCQTSDVRHLMSDIKHRGSPLRQVLDKLHMVPESSLYTWHRSCVKWLLRLDCQNSCTVLVWDKLQNSEYLGLEWSGYNKYRKLIWKKN